MANWKRRSTTEQFFEFLRTELLRGRWGGSMPGVHALSAEFGINRKVVEASLKLLEKEGFLKPQGTGRRKLITLPRSNKEIPSLKLGILLGESATRSRDYHLELRHELTDAGHTVFYTPRFMVELDMDVKRIGRMIGKMKADAWIIGAGSREILEWYIEQEIPAFALFGRRGQLPIPGAGPNKSQALIEATQRLIELGHERIVLVNRRRRRLPEPGEFEKAFLNELTAHGISTGPYNLPDWEENIDGLQKCLRSLFRLTPPTALIIDEPALFFATQLYLTNQGIRVPEDVSLICTDYHPVFGWSKPSVAHLHNDMKPIVRRVVQWAGNVARGVEDNRQTLVKTRFIEGGTIGRARKS